MTVYVLTCIYFALVLNVFAAPPFVGEFSQIYRAVEESRQWELGQRHRTKREETSVCYPELGCFQASGPFGYLDMLPSTPEHIDTKFLLYPSHSKRRSGSTPTEVPFNNISDAFSWANQGFNRTLNTKVLVHGFGSDCSHIWVYEMRSALMAVEDLNVICVDWGKGATLPNYVRASANTRLVGKQLAILLKGLVEQNGLSFRSMHLIGFSLGAHVAGFAGAELGNLSRITGLDPAGPLFESQDPRARLDQTDATFVDVIHSNGENLILGGLGSWQPMGHVDFYPNGGRMQKGCSNIFVGAVSDIIWSTAVEGRSLCNHRRAYKFFTDSVSPRCHFPAFPCDSYDDFLAGNCFPCTDERKCGNMGYYADRSKGRGQLYLITRDEEPFCAHQYKIRIESTPSEIPIVSYGKLQVTLIGDSLLNETFTLTKKEDEEMRLGASFSRIIVPHPILLEPHKIQVLYTAYSGWLTSGLLQWRIDKITLSDSFGRSASVCKKSLILDSGVPVTLPLFPGECNPPTDSESNKNASNRFDGGEVFERKETNRITFRDAFEMFNIPWTNNDNNYLDADQSGEQSRAFNGGTATAKAVENLKNTSSSSNEEVVEPVLKPGKSGRAQDLSKSEITEPILGSTIRSIAKSNKSLKNADKLEDYQQRASEDRSDWIPAVPAPRSTTLKTLKLDAKWDKQGEPPPKLESMEELNTFNAIVKTVQFIPQRLARMFEEAERYARETILPFVSTYTPKFLSDFIGPKEPQKYVPLVFEETNVTTEAIKTSTINSTEATVQKGRNIQLITGSFDNQTVSSTEISNAVYINLPVIDEKNPKEIKYIPLNSPSSSEATKRDTSNS